MSHGVTVHTQKYDVIHVYPKPILAKVTNAQRHCVQISCTESTARLIQSTPSHVTLSWSILILFSHLSLGIPSGLIISDFPTKMPYVFVFTHTHTRTHANTRARTT